MSVRRLAVIVSALVLTLVACHQVLGLTDLEDKDPSTSGEGGPGDEEGGTPPAPGQECKFDKSRFDDGCVFAP